MLYQDSAEDWEPHFEFTFSEKSSPRRSRAELRIVAIGAKPQSVRKKSPAAGWSGEGFSTSVQGRLCRANINRREDDGRLQVLSHGGEIE